MQARLYIDEDAMDDDLVQALRLRGVDVQTALAAGLTNRPLESLVRVFYQGWQRAMVKLPLLEPEAVQVEKL